MPLLGGLFSRKNKTSSRLKRDAQTESLNDSVVDSNVSSPTASYVIPDLSLPSSPNAGSLLHPDSARDKPASQIYPSMVASSSSSSSSTSKIRLFGRKKSAAAVDVSRNAYNDGNTQKQTTSPRPSYLGRGSTSTSPDEDATSFRRLRPPPSRSAIFAAYSNDSNGSLSTHSLPNEPTLTDTPPSSSGRRPSIFPWSKSSSASAPPRSHVTETTPVPPVPPLPPLPPSESKESFNLKAFRHVRPPSPTAPNNGSNISLTAPIPRPRGASVNSDSSQRISVAAFREAQARRSLAGSPVASLRSPSPGPSLPHTSPLGTEARVPRPSRSSPHVARPRSSIAIEFTSDSEDSSSAQDDSEDETLNARTANKARSHARPGKNRAKSEMGHGQPVQSSFRQNYPPATPRAPKSHSGHSTPHLRTSQVPLKTESPPELPPRSQSSLSYYTGGSRQRASVSTSAVSPSSEARRASLLVSATPVPVPQPQSKPMLSPSSNSGSPTVSNDERTKINTAYNRSMTNVAKASEKSDSTSSSDSEDDAPLATLVGPRRPGSAMSSYSATHSRSGASIQSRVVHKPLIDINELTAGKPTTVMEKNTAGFTQGPTLLNDSRFTTSPRSPLSEPPVNRTPDLNAPLTSTVPPVKFVSPPSSPRNEPRAFLDASVEPGSNGRNSSPEQRRDALTDRLSRAVHRTLSPVERSSSPSKSPTSSSSPLPPLLPVESSPRAISPPNTDPPPKAPRPTLSRPILRTSIIEQAQPSPPDQDLAQLLGAAAKFISRNGESPVDSTDTDTDTDSSPPSPKEKVQPAKDVIAPIPIKRRSPPPSFKVTSRPTFPRRGETLPPLSDQTPEERTVPSHSLPNPRPRSTTLIPPSSTSSATPSPPAPFPSMPNGTGGKASSTSVHSPSSNTPPALRSDLNPPAVRQRSSTMITSPPIPVPQPKLFPAPERPFIAARRNSPASSTGDSSSGRAPLTPRDGSEVGTNVKREEWGSGVSGLGAKERAKRRSVSFEEDLKDARGPVLPPSRGREPARGKEAFKGNSDVNPPSKSEELEQRRRERRRSEAKAAIELGNVINGRGPVLTDDESDLPGNPALNARSSTMNPMGGMVTPSMPMGFGAPAMSPGWMPNMQQPMLSPAQFMAPPPADPQFFAAHHQAMMIAKQAYQMAVAQQAMAAAADEWERGSAIGGYSGSMYNGSGGGGPAPMVSPYGMVGMMPGGGWGGSPAPVYLPSSSHSMYGSHLGVNQNMSSSRSEYGGVSSGAANWSSSRSSYGASFGPPTDQYGRKAQQAPRRPANGGRDSGYFPPPPPIPASQMQNGRSSPDMRGSPRSRTTSQPANLNRGLAVPRNAPPPSSWKPGM